MRLIVQLLFTKLMLPRVNPCTYVRMVSSVKAPASLISSLVNTQNSRCGDVRENALGRGSVVRKMNSLPAGGGKVLGPCNTHTHTHIELQYMFWY